MLKRFEKLQYMVIGAVLMAVGIGIGAIFTQPLDAQRNNVFDTITCRRLIVIDANGKGAVTLGSDTGVNWVTVFDDEGKKAIYITSQPAGNLLNVYDTENDDLAIGLASSRKGSSIAFYGIGDEAPVVSLGYMHMPERMGMTINSRDGSTPVALIGRFMNEHLIEIYDEKGLPGVRLNAESGDNYLGVYDASGKLHKYTESTSTREKRSITITVPE